MQARAIEAEQEALAHEAARVAELLGRRLRLAERGRAEAPPRAPARQAQLDGDCRRKLQRATLEVNDCVLRAPFDGEVADARRRSRARSCARARRS